MIRRDLRNPSAPAPLSRGERGERRAGLTLLEVVIALAIFLIALVPLMSLITMGGETALDIGDQAQASMLAQSKLDSVKAGVEPLNTNGSIDIGNRTWNYTIECSQADVENLYLCKITVKTDRPNGTTIQADLSQLVFDPNYRGSTISNNTSSTPPSQGS
jgi:type II secretion system protein I